MALTAVGLKNSEHQRGQAIPVSGSSFRIIGFVVVLAVVLARSFTVLYWPDVYFDADQAVMGLMAKHLAEGRAFPVFQYAWSYVLVLEAWLLAPLWLVAEGSVALVKSVPVGLNVVTAALLYSILTSAGALRPGIALVAIAPFALPAPGTAGDLTDALGMSIEPLLFALLLWVWRERPVALGVTAAIAVKNREFALYAAAALLVVDLVRDRSPALWRGRIVALTAFGAAWSAVELLTQYSSPWGPGTTFAMAAGGGDSLSVAAAAACVDPRHLPHDLWVTVSELLPIQFGLAARPAFSRQPLNVPWLWVPLVVILGGAASRGLWRAFRDGPTPITWFGVYLLLIGVQAVLVYAGTRCGLASILTIRYLLLAMLAPIGALALGLEREGHRSIRMLIGGIVILWVGVCVLNHVAQVRDFIRTPPERGYRQLATYLDGRGVRFIVTDYWTGYYVAFLTNERINALTDFDRVHEYALSVRANREHAVEVRRMPAAPCERAVSVAGFYVCPSSVTVLPR